MNTSYCSLAESSDDASIFVNHGLTRSHRKKVIIDSSDDESTAKSASKDGIVVESPSDDDTLGGSSNADNELRNQMSKLTVRPSDSAWAYDNAKGEFFLTSAEFEIFGVTWPKFSLPEKLFESLYPHQKVGVQWAASMHSNMIGGILADDMGLGKTWSSLTFIGGLMRPKTILSALVIAPVSILRSWAKEAQKVITPDCVPNLQIHVLTSHTQRKDRQRILRAALSGDKRIQHLIITSYGLVSNDPQDFVCGSRGFDYVVLDEAHKIKNDSTQMTKGCRRVCSCDNTRRLLLTGTPIQNNLKEMWVLFDFATSGRLLGPYRRVRSSESFKKDFGDPIELGRNKNATESTIKAAERANSKLQSLLKPHFLQRMKVDVLSDMPLKQEFVVWTHLSTDQRRLYEDYVTNGDTVNAVLSSETKSPLVAVDWLRKLIGHPLLVDDRYDRERSTLHRLSVSTLLQQSAKLEVLVGLIEKLSTSGHRTLIFSNTTMTLDIIQRVLHGLNVSRIDGTVRENDRQRLVEEFNREDSNVDVMLLSTKAGGLGLTLTGADRAVIYNPSWNPTDDSQAVDRCYRIGQKRPVEVYRFIAAGTVEEKTYEKQIFKDGINRVVTTSSGNNTERYFDKKDLSSLFKLAPEGKCELLEKLQIKGRVGNVNASLQKRFFDQHNGVIGLSRHDAVYLEETTANDSSTDTPFGGATPMKKIGKARRALLRNPSERVPLQTGVDTIVQPRRVPSSPNAVGPHLSVGTSPSRFETVKAVISRLRGEGRNSKALHYLLDLLDHQEQLLKEQRLWMHQQIAYVSSVLGMLPN